MDKIEDIARKTGKGIGEMKRRNREVDRGSPDAVRQKGKKKKKKKKMMKKNKKKKIIKVNIT